MSSWFVDLRVVNENDLSGKVSYGTNNELIVIHDKILNVTATKICKNEYIIKVVCSNLSKKEEIKKLFYSLDFIEQLELLKELNEDIDEDN